MSQHLLWFSIRKKNYLWEEKLRKLELFSNGIILQLQCRDMIQVQNPFPDKADGGSGIYNACIQRKKKPHR